MKKFLYTIIMGAVIAPITIHELSIKKEIEGYTLDIHAQTSALFRTGNQISGTQITCTVGQAAQKLAIIQGQDYTLDHQQKSINFSNGVITELFLK